MNVGSYLEIYTTMFGWSVYNTLYDLFNVTGLLYLPFLLLIYKNWRDPYLSQDDKPAAVTSQRRMTWGVLSIVIVFSLGVLPFAPLSLNEVNYKVACTAAGGGTTTTTDVDGGNTGTTYDNTSMGNVTVRIPIIWWMVLSISSGINYAATQSFRCFEDIGALDQQLRNLTLKDPALRQEYYRFANECFLPAKSKYMRAMRENEHHTYVTTALANWLSINTDYDVDDPYFIGSHFYLETDGFYKGFNKEADCAALPGGCGFQAETPVTGWPYVAARDNYSQADITANTPGRPFCGEWWEDTTRGIEKRLLENVEASAEIIPDWDPNRSAFENIVDSIVDIWGAATYSDEQLEDLVIQRFVATDPPRMLGKKGANNFTSMGPSNPWQNAEGVAGLAAAGVAGAATAALFPAVGAAAGTAALSTGLSVAKEFAGFYTMMYVIKSAAPMIQAVLLMMIYILLLIYLVVSEYEVDSVITAIFLLLAIRFFTPMWAIADYLDAQLFLAMFPDATWLGSDITFAVERLLLDMVLTLLYVAAPVLLLSMMAMASQKIGRMAGDGGMGGAIQKTGGGVGKAGRLR